MKNYYIYFCMILLSGCAEVHNYHCPPVHEQFKTMTSQDEKYLGRKSHHYKKAFPLDPDKREGYSGEEQFKRHGLNNHHHHARHHTSGHPSH